MANSSTDTGRLGKGWIDPTTSQVVRLAFVGDGRLHVADPPALLQIQF